MICDYCGNIEVMAYAKGTKKRCADCYVQQTQELAKSPSDWTK